jgi:hypothetical protein
MGKIPPGVTLAIIPESNLDPNAVASNPDNYLMWEISEVLTALHEAYQVEFNKPKRVAIRKLHNDLADHYNGNISTKYGKITKLRSNVKHKKKGK